MINICFAYYQCYHKWEYCLGVSSSCRKTGRMSLSKILLSLESNAAKQKALQHILNALQVVLENN